MKMYGFWILIFIFLSSPLLSQQLDMFGYFESQFMAARVKSEILQMQSNKMRLDFESIQNCLHFGANINAITYHGKTDWIIPDYLPDRVCKEIPASIRSYYVLTFENELELDNAYVRIAFHKWDLTLGKQQISLGSGYAWNPTDLFNQKDLFDPTYEQPGHNAVRVDIPLASRLNGMILYAPDDDWNNSAKLVSFKTGIGRFDYTIMAIEKGWTFHDYTAFYGFDFQKTVETRRMLGSSLVGELFGWGVWFECGYNRMQIRDHFYEITAGMNYTFDFQTYIMIEYYRNSMARSRMDNYTLNDWMRYLASEQKALNRDQLYVLIQHPVSDLTDLGLNVIAAGDKSLALLPTLRSTPFENVELLAYGNLYLGKESAVFHRNLGNGGLVRMRIYF
ncbi:hypothetical protein JW835_00535 [bacterium]|nr:hypothetical protein [bacterium]